MKANALIFDVDGTLADVSPILHHLLDHDDPIAYHTKSLDVAAHEEIARIARMEYLWGNHVIVVTARKERWRAITAAWLARHQIHHHALFMRGDGDNRSDYEVKKDILTAISKHWNVTAAWDDNPHIITLWQEHGIQTTKVGDWDGS